MSQRSICSESSTSAKSKSKCGNPQPRRAQGATTQERLSKTPEEDTPGKPHWHIRARKPHYMYSERRPGLAQGSGFPPPRACKQQLLARRTLLPVLSLLAARSRDLGLQHQRGTSEGPDSAYFFMCIFLVLLLALFGFHWIQGCEHKATPLNSTV